MKKLMFLLFLSILALSSVAQNNLQKVDTATLPVRSGREDGFLIRPQLSFSTTMEYYPNFLFGETLCTLAYQLGSRMSIGFGTGFLGSDLSISLGERSGKALFSIPIYLDVRCYVLDRLWSPYVEFRGGLNLNLNESYFDLKQEFENCMYYDVYEYIKGPLFDLSIGVQYKNIDCGFSIKKLSMVRHENYYYVDHYEIEGAGYDNIYDEDNYRRNSILSLSFNFAYNFPLKGKTKN